MQGPLIEAVGEGSWVFGELVPATACPVVARARALHLIWHGRLAVYLAEPLGDSPPVWAGSEGRWG